MVGAVADWELLFVLATHTQVEVFALFTVNSSSDDEALTLVTLEPEGEQTHHCYSTVHELIKRRLT